MTRVLEIKAFLIGFYKSYDKIINSAAKFLFILLATLKLNAFLGHVGILNQFIVNVVIAAIATFIPGSWFVVVLMGIVAFQFYSAGFLEATLIIGMVMLVIYLLFVRLFPKMAYFVVLVPLAISFNIPYVIPILAGMFIGPTAIVSIATGVFVHRAGTYLPNLLTTTSPTLYDIPDTLVSMYKYVIDTILSDRTLFLMIFVYALVVVITYILVQFELDYINYIAIGVGALTNILGFIIGSVAFRVQVSVGQVILGSILAALICAFVQFMRFTLDYSRKERLQFEDEEYYYYVKAIPKVVVVKADKEVKKIRS